MEHSNVQEAFGSCTPALACAGSLPRKDRPRELIPCRNDYHDHPMLRAAYAFGANWNRLKSR
jgi:hypothetical protein